LLFKRIFRDLDESLRVKAGGSVMVVPDFMVSTGAWLAPVAAIACVGIAAAAILLRDYLRVERRALALEAQVSQLETQVRSLMDNAARERVPAFPARIDCPATTRLAFAMPETAASADSAAGAEPALANDAKGSPGPKRVLLAEDDEANALFAVKSLERVGAIIDWAKDGVEAVTMIEEAFAGSRPDYDLVLMDLRMPRLGGLDATRQIRALEAAIGRPEPLCIAAVTATAMRKDRLGAHEAGMSVFVSKPYAADALTQLLDHGAGGFAHAS
jgi:CheY-like chemotaxis protein